MDSYTSFAQVYDAFMDNVPYEEWTQYVTDLLKDYGVIEGLVLELGCGTGALTQLLSNKGFDMIGLDNSLEMLEIAMVKSANDENSILYLNQDMREFELYGTVKAIVSVCDSINYITKEEDLTKVLKLVNNYLDPQGVFIFDFNTKYKYETVLADNVFAENREECSFIWDNMYYEEEEINEYQLSIFVKEKDDLYRKYEEMHYQKAYTIESIKRLVQESGLEYVMAYDAFSKQAPRADSERIYVIAREKGKNR